MRLRLKRYYPLLVLLCVVTVVFTVGLGDRRIIAYTVEGQEEQEPVGVAYINSVSLFDQSVVHSIQITMDPDDYDQMITTYQQTGEKEYFHASVVIDGVSLADVGVRLKGNASLRTAVGGKGGFGGFNFGGNPPGQNDGNNAGVMPQRGQRPDFPNGQRPNLPGGQAPQNQADPPANPNSPTPQVGDQPAAPNGQAPGAGDLPALPNGALPGMGNLPQGGDAFGPPVNGAASEEDAKIPLLIKFDEYVEDQNYQGYTKLAIRTYGTSYDAAMLQEPVTNAILDLAGLPATQTAYAGVSLNGAAEELFSLSEVIDEAYLAEHFANPDGVLYKSEVGANLSYEGDDPSAYAASFSQETRENDADLAPLIDFIKFVDQSDDATFESELPQRFDVEAFATYLAVNDLLVNTDSIIGMNNNYYLYYDETAQRFTLLMWDANESLGKLGGNGQADNYDLYFADAQNDMGGGFPDGGRQGGGMRMGGTNR
ncbi:MAG TPA: CotH kinase family protein, partial [Anaerolineaceae bacterium]|nr:CotH kinase family protein [Anaerolineaceae bacterium]